jgi:hypothetical protein
LAGQYSIAGFCLSTRKTPRAVLRIQTLSTAEIAFIAIRDANVFSATGTIAIAAILTWLAQIGMFGNTDEDDIRVGSTNLLALPARRTLFLTGFGTDSLPEMFDTPTRLAIAIFGAIVQKTPFAWLASQDRDIRSDVHIDIKEHFIHQVPGSQVGNGHGFGRDQLCHNIYYAEITASVTVGFEESTAAGRSNEMKKSKQNRSSKGHSSGLLESCNQADPKSFIGVSQ